MAHDAASIARLSRVLADGEVDARALVARRAQPATSLSYDVDSAGEPRLTARQGVAPGAFDFEFEFV